MEGYVGEKFSGHWAIRSLGRFDLGVVVVMEENRGQAQVIASRRIRWTTRDGLVELRIRSQEPLPPPL